MRFFDRLLEHRVPLNLLFLLGLAAGLLSLSRMSVEEYPNVSFDQVEIRTLFPGASAIEVERLVTREIEAEIEDVRGVDWIRSSSVQDLSRVLVKLHEDLPDFERSYRDLESRVRRAIPELPDGAEEPIVSRIEVEGINPVVSLLLGGDVSEEVLRAASLELERRLERVDGVRRVRATGRRDREVHVEVDHDRLTALGLTLPEVADALRARNRNIPSGTLAGSGSELAVRAVGEWRSLDELLETAIRTESAGGTVRLREVAEVRAAYEDELVTVRARGGRSILLSVIKVGDANALTVRDGVARACEAFEREAMPAGMELSIGNDTTRRIRARVAALLQNIGLGAVLVIALLGLAIGIRMSLLAVVGIGFAFVGSFVALDLLGQSINTLSLFGLVLVTGMLVDDAIIVLENIARHRDRGASLREACVQGASEVAWPVTASVLTTVAAFLPLLLMSGVTGRFFAVIPIAVCAALLVSLIEVVFMMPVHVAEVGLGRSRFRAHGGAAGGGVILRAVGGLIAWTTAHRYVMVLIMLAVGAATVAGGSRLPVVFFPSEYQSFFVNLRMPPGTSLEQTTRAVDRIDEAVRGLPEGMVASSFGTPGFYFDFNYQPHHSTHYGQLMVTVPEGRARTATLVEVMDEARRQIAALDLGGASVEVVELNDGPPIGRPVTLRVQCPDLDRLREAAAAVEEIVRDVPGVRDVTSGLEEGKYEVAARIDEERAAARGVTSVQIGRALAAANQGEVATRFRATAEDWDVRVRLPAGARRTSLDLGEVRVRTQKGAAIPLRDVATLEERPTYAAIERFRGERTVTITGDVDRDVTSVLAANFEIQRRLEPVLAERPEVRVLYAGEFEETQRSFESLAQALLIALLAIYVILGAQFRSYLQPFVILFAVPFSFAGVVLGLHLTGDPLTVPVLLGVVGLAGLAVNDSIVLISFANANRRRGMAALEAVREAARVRFRPLVLTTVTTAGALLPAAVGLGPEGRSVIWGPMAAAFSFGIASATLLTLLVTPALYLIADDLVRRVLGGGSDAHAPQGLPAGEAAEAPAAPPARRPTAEAAAP